jgi:hypothetical protein
MTEQRPGTYADLSAIAVGAVCKQALPSMEQLRVFCEQSSIDEIKTGNTER